MLHHSPAARAPRVLAVLALGLAACSSDPATPDRPAAALDAGRLTAGTAAISSALGTPAWQSFRVMAPSIVASSGGNAVVTGGIRNAASTATGIADPQAAATFARAQLAALLVRPAAPPVAPHAVVPQELLGKTFVWDTATGQYVVDPARTDAPASGVRHVLYPVNPITGKPASTEELGYVDLIDEGASLTNGEAIRIVVSAGGITYLDYALSVTAAPSSAIVQVDGFLSDGTDRVEFHVDGGMQAGTGAAFAYQVAVPARDFRAEATITSDGTRNNVQERITVGTQLVGFTATHAGDTVQAAVAVDGVPFATITGLAALPEIRRADGLPLTADEASALRNILELTGRTLAFFGDLLSPLGGPAT